MSMNFGANLEKNFKLYLGISQSDCKFKQNYGIIQMIALGKLFYDKWFVFHWNKTVSISNIL